MVHPSTAILVQSVSVKMQENNHLTHAWGSRSVKYGAINGGDKMNVTTIYVQQTPVISREEAATWNSLNPVWVWF